MPLTRRRSDGNSPPRSAPQSRRLGADGRARIRYEQIYYSSLYRAYLCTRLIGDAWSSCAKMGHSERTLAVCILVQIALARERLV